MRKNVVLLSRAYNDIDCRMPLLLEFAKDKKYKVEIVGIPSNAGIYDPRKHELSAFLADNNISISTVYDRAVNKPLLKTAYRTYLLLSGRLSRWFFKIVFWLSVREKGWIKKILGDFHSSIIILDEIAFHRGRSFFVDELLLGRETGGYSAYSFLVGQNPYLNLWHDKKAAAPNQAGNRIGIPFFVPSVNDKDVMEGNMAQEDIEVVGNTRFDSSWVQTLSDFASKNIQKIDILKEPAAHKIVFMLSKIEYGVDLENIVEAMNACAAISNARVIVKPHTRGMSMGELGKGLDKKVVDGTCFSSNDLIEWADTVLFTGSSVVFQAMQLRKKVIFLRYCQRYNSIYDGSNALLIAHSQHDVLKMINSCEADGVSSGAIESFLTEHVYNGLRSGRICQALKEKIEILEQRELSHVS